MAVVAAGICGCGGPDGPAGKVSGKVTSGAGPLTEVNVQFLGTDGVPVAAAKVDESGEFELDQRIPTGDYQVVVLPIVEETEAGPENPAYIEAGKKVPLKYWDAKTSGLTAVVKEGDNSFTFEVR
ncbi:MAG: carboxypeptidase-like regulatory domain-containing protein [Planctomycetota bacterium]